MITRLFSWKIYYRIERDAFWQGSTAGFIRFGKIYYRIESARVFSLMLSTYCWEDLL